MKQIILSLLVFVIVTSFSKNEDGVSVIFQNNTGKNFRSFRVNIVGRQFIFSNLKNGQQTPVIIVPKCYRYCNAQAITATDTLLCQHDDHVGETAYFDGKILMNVSSHSEKELEKYIDVSGIWDADHFILPKKLINQ